MSWKLSYLSRYIYRYICVYNYIIYLSMYVYIFTAIPIFLFFSCLYINLTFHCKELTVIASKKLRENVCAVFLAYKKFGFLAYLFLY